jgi:4'-phosphopantetheinyl transferase
MAIPSEAVAREAKVARGEVHLWRFALAVSRGGAQAGLRGILSAYVGLPPAQIAFRTARRSRRPMLAHGICPELSFNLAHSGREALLAVTRSRRVGVDIERARPTRSHEALARRFFSPREVERLLAIDNGECEAAFFRTWVRKEAYLKAVGGGVPAGLRRFSVSVVPDKPPAILATELEPCGVSSLSLYDLDVPDGYAGALAVEGTEHRICYMSTNVGDKLRRYSSGTAMIP